MMIRDRRFQMRGEPADDFRVQRLAGAAHNTQPAAHRCSGIHAAALHQSISGGRSRQVGNVERGDRAICAFDSEGPFIDSDPKRIADLVRVRRIGHDHLRFAFLQPICDDLGAKGG